MLIEELIAGNARQIFDVLNIGLLIEDADRKIVYTNKHLFHLFDLEYRGQDYIGVDAHQTTENAKKYFKDPDKYIDDKSRYPAELKVQEEVVETTTNKYLRKKYAPIFEGSDLKYHIWTYEDVTESVTAQKALNKQQEFFHQVLDELPADIAIFSPEHTYRFVNKMGIKSEEIRKWIIGKTDYDYVQRKGLDNTMPDLRAKRFSEVKETMAPVKWVDEIAKPNESKEYILRILYPYVNDGNELEYIIAYGVNITDQKKKELDIAHAKERFSSMVSSLKDGVFQCKFNGDVLMGNEKVMNMINDVIPIKEGAVVNIFDIVHRDDIDKLLNGAKMLRDTRVPQRGVVRLKEDKQGIIRYVDTYVWLQEEEEHGEVFAGRISDVTEQMEKHYQMKDMIKKEQELNSLKSNFIHITSHELRTPLSVILSSAEILQMLSLSEQCKTANVDPSEFLDSIVKEVNRIAEILDEMLMVGRIEKGTLNFKPEKTDIIHYINAIVEELYMPYKDGRSLVFNSSDMELLAHIDMRLMRHAVSNILSNAFKYSIGKPSPELVVKEDGPKIIIEVKDYGIGIPKEELGLLFNSFYRASNVGGISGNGIGLMVVEHVMNMHDGSIEVDSNKGEGTTFRLIIPK